MINFHVAPYGHGIATLCAFALSLLLNSAQALDSQLIYTHSRFNLLQVGPLTGGVFTAVGTTKEGVNMPGAISIDEDTGELYFFSGPSNDGRISRLNVDGSSTLVSTVVPGVLFGTTLAIDSLNDRIYWTHSVFGAGPVNGRFITHMPLSGGTPTTIYNSGDPARGPIGLAVDPQSGKLYWTDSQTSSVHRSNLDGSSQETLYFLGAAVVPGAISLDLLGHVAYWTDTTADKIQRADMDGTGIVSDVTGGSALLHLAVDNEDRKVYWLEAGNPQVANSGAILRANLDGSSPQTLLSGVDPAGIALDIETPVLTIATTIEAPPAVRVDGNSASITMKDFSGIELAALLGLNAENEHPALALLPGEVSIKYQATVSADDAKSLDTYRTAVSKKRVITFNNLEPNQWVATYKVFIASKRTKDATQKFVTRFNKQLDKAKPGSKKEHILKKVKLKLQAKFGLPFVTNESPPAPFEISAGG